MHFISASFSNISSLFVSVNSTNEYVATASQDGNIRIRRMDQFTDLIESSSDQDTKTSTDIGKSANSEESKSPSSPDDGESKNIIDLDKESTPLFSIKDGNTMHMTPQDGKHPPTMPLHAIEPVPSVDKEKLKLSQRPVNIVGVRSRSKITSLKYANLKRNWNLLAAVYKNGEVYIVKDPQDSRKASIRQIFKHANGLLLDFSWSADDQLLAFCTMNNEVIIYDTVYSRVISTLHVHGLAAQPQIRDKSSSNGKGSGKSASPPQSTDLKQQQLKSSTQNVAVKGIAFDHTCGKYLLTLGDDKMVNILEYRLTPSESTGRSFEYAVSQKFYNLISSSKLNKATIRKVSWSADDRVVCVPNTAKSRATILSLVKNNSPEKSPAWQDWMVQKGRGFKCTMTSFSPCMYENESKDGDSKFTYVIATASPDSSVSIWRTCDSAPFYVANDISAKPIQDICWSKDGRMLFLTTYSGKLILGVFKDNELGKAVSEENLIIPDIDSSSLKRSAAILESYNSWIGGVRRPTSEKQESLGETVAANSVAENGTEAKKAAGSSSIPMLNIEEPVKVQTTKSQEANHTATNTDGKNTAGKSTAGKSVDEKSADGKNNTTGKGPRPSTSRSHSSHKVVSSGLVGPFEPPSKAVPKDLSRKISAVSQAAASNSNQAEEGPARKKREVEPTDFVGSLIIDPTTSFSNVRIAIPRVRWHIDYSLAEDKTIHFEVRNGNGHESYPTRIALVKRSLVGLAQEAGSKAYSASSGANTAIPTSKELFVDFVPRKVHIVTGSLEFWALATTDGQIITYTRFGRRLLPTIVLGTPLSFLEMKDEYLLAVTSSAEMYAWDLRKQQALFKPTTLSSLLKPLFRNSSSVENGGKSTGHGARDSKTGGSHNDETNGRVSGTNGSAGVSFDKNGFVFVNGEMLTRSENLTLCSITASGVPIVTLSNGNGYLYNKNMGVWSIVSDSWWAFGSQYWDSTKSLTDTTKSKTDGSSLLGYLEMHTNDEIARRGRSKFFSKISKVMLMREGFENMETVISLNHLENKINFYLFLQDFDNFRLYLIIYVKRLGELNLVDRLTEVLQELFLDMDGKICGVERKSLLEEIIVSCAKQREVQRILVQYGESVGLLESSLV